MDELQALPGRYQIILALLVNAAIWGTAFAVLYLTRNKWWYTLFGRVWAVLALTVALTLDLTVYSNFSFIYHRPLGEDTWFFIQTVCFGLLGASLFAITVVLAKMQHDARLKRLIEEREMLMFDEDDFEGEEVDIQPFEEAPDFSSSGVLNDAGQQDDRESADA